MVIYTVYPGRGGTPLEPQLFYNPDLVAQAQQGSQQQPFAQYNWPNPLDFRDYRTWSGGYTLVLIGQDKLPVGKTIYDTPPYQYTYQSPAYPNQLRTLTNSPAPPIPPGPPGILFNKSDWPNPQPVVWYTDWSHSPNIPPVVVQQIPFLQFDWPNPRGPEYHNQLRTLINSPAPTVVSLPFNQTDWPNPRGNPPPVQSWTYQYILDLIGQDKFPIGEILYNLPPQLVDTQVRSWTVSRQLTSAAQNPFVQTDWPNPQSVTWYKDWIQQLRIPVLPVGRTTNLVTIGNPPPVQSWTNPYLLTLIGQDRLPNRQQDWPNPQTVVWYRDWYFSPKVPPVVVTNLPPGQVTNQLVLGPDYPIQLRTLINSPAPPASGTLPPTNYDWPLPRDYQRVTPSWSWQYNLNLIGMDQLPIGGADGQNQQFGIPIPPPYVDYTWLHSPLVPSAGQLPPGKFTNVLTTGPDYPVQLRTLINGPAPVFVAPARLPFFQTDWPLPQGYPLPVKDWESWYNLNLIGMDQFPVGGNTTGGQNDSHGIVIYPEYPIQLRTITSGPAPSTVAVQLPYNQYNWPNPTPVTWYKDWYQSPNPPPTNLLFIPLPVEWDLPDQVVYPVQSVTENNLPLLTFVVTPLPPGVRIYDLPGQPVYPSQLASMTSGPAPVFVPPPPVTDLHFKPHLVTIGRMGYLGGLS